MTLFAIVYRNLVQTKYHDNLRAKMKSIFFALFFFPISLFSVASAEIYTWIDENGKTQFSNSIPPSNGRVVAAKQEIRTPENQLESRIEQKKADSDLEEQEKSIERAAAKVQRQAKKAEQARQARKEREAKKRSREEAQAERQVLAGKEKNWISKCQGIRTGYVNLSKCEDKVKKRFVEVSAILSSYPEYYFKNDHRIDQETERILKIDREQLRVRSKEIKR